MSEYSATVVWERGLNEAFLDKRYSRGHRWEFDGGVTIPASSAPAGVPLPYSVAEAVDPEEAFIASLSSCHMLWFLAIAAKRKFVVDSYRDAAIGVMGRGTDGKIAMTRVTLRPAVQFSGDMRPSADDMAAMHLEAHDECYIANSVKTEVVCEPDE